MSLNIFLHMIPSHIVKVVMVIFQGSFDEPSHYEDPPKVETPATTSHPPLSKIVRDIVFNIIYQSHSIFV